MSPQIIDYPRYAWQLLHGQRSWMERTISEQRQRDIAACLDVGRRLRVLDLANGRLRPQYVLLKAMGHDVFGIDLVNRPLTSWKDRAYSVARWLYTWNLGLPGAAEQARTLACGNVGALPYPDASFDLVTSIAAFEHFLDVPSVVAELHRVLRPGGALALVWNVRDESVDWVRRFGELLVAAAADDPASAEFQATGKPYEEGTDWVGVIAAAGGFTPVRREVLPWAQPIDPDLLVRRAASTSFVSALPDDARADALDRIRDLAATHPDLAGRASFGFPHETVVYWCHSTD